MKKQQNSKTSTIIAVMVACMLAYYMLLHENCFHTSIGEIIEFSHSLEITQHVFILGILPIYIAIILFGAVMFGIYLGSKLPSIFLKLIKN